MPGALHADPDRAVIGQPLAQPLVTFRVAAELVAVN